MTKPKKTRSGGDGDNVRFERPYLVLVEGADDQAIISELIIIEGLEDFQVHDMNGKDQWQRRLGVISKAPEFISNVVGLGLVKDADALPSGAFDSCRFSLERSGLPVPKAPVVAAAGKPATAVLIVPSITDLGAIEDLCLKSFDEDRMQCVENYFDCLANRYPTTKRTGKGLVQAYLGGLEEPLRDLTLAAARRKIDLSNSCFDDARQFLQNLASAT
jgi:hypothetical protein